MNTAVLMRELAAAVDAPVLDGDAVTPYLLDATEARGLRGRADAVVLARTADDVARVLAWCYEHDVPITVRGGGTGLSGGAVPDGRVVISLERLNCIRSIEPEWGRCEVRAGVTTEGLHRRARAAVVRSLPRPRAGGACDCDRRHGEEGAAAHQLGTAARVLRLPLVTPGKTRRHGAHRQ